MKKRGLLLVGDYSEFQAEYKMVAQMFEKMNIEMTPVNYRDILVFAENHEDASFFNKDENMFLVNNYNGIKVVNALDWLMKDIA